MEEGIRIFCVKIHNVTLSTTKGDMCMTLTSSLL